MSIYKYHYHFNLLNKAILHVTFYLYFTLISACDAYCMLHIVPVAWAMCNHQHAANERAERASMSTAIAHEKREPQQPCQYVLASLEDART